MSFEAKNRIVFLFILIIGMFSCSDAAKQSAAPPPPPNYLKVSSFYPTDTELAPTNTKIFISFDRGIDPDSITGNVALSLDGTTIDGVNLALNNTSLILTPPANLNAQSEYKISLANVKGMDGLGLEKPLEWLFTTDQQPDNQSPSVSNTVPAVGDTNLNKRPRIKIVFDEPVNIFTIDQGDFTLKDTRANVDIPFSIDTFAFAGSAGVSFVKEIYINAHQVIPFGNSIEVTVANIEDRAGLVLVSPNPNLSYSIEPDTDGDGMPDSFERKYTGGDNQALDPQADIETIGTPPVAAPDGLNNLGEYEHGSDPTVVDSDADGVNDGDEVTQGRNPAVNEPAVVSIIDNLLLD